MATLFFICRSGMADCNGHFLSPPPCLSYLHYQWALCPIAASCSAVCAPQLEAGDIMVTAGPNSACPCWVVLKHTSGSERSWSLRAVVEVFWLAPLGRSACGLCRVISRGYCGRLCCGVGTVSGY